MHICRNGCLNQIFLILFDFPFPSGLGAYAPDYLLDGNYLKTLETGYKIARFCYDRDNNRILLSMDDDIQFGYLDMKEFLD